MRLDCLDAALTLVTLNFAIDLGGDDLETDLSSTLDEAEVAPDLESIEDNFENVQNKLEDKCDEENVQDILEFIDFNDWYYEDDALAVTIQLFRGDPIGGDDDYE